MPYTQNAGPDTDDLTLASSLLKYVKKNFPGTLDKLISEEGKCTFNEVCECLDEYVAEKEKDSNTDEMWQPLCLFMVPGFLMYDFVPNSCHIN